MPGSPGGCRSGVRPANPTWLGTARHRPPQSWDFRSSALARYCGRVASEWKRQRCRERVEGLADSERGHRRPAPRGDRDPAGDDRLRSLVLAAARSRHARDQPRHRPQRLELRPPASQPARSGPGRRQQPRNARAQPQSRGRPERGDGRRSRPLRAAGATSSRATAWATSLPASPPTSAAAGATSASGATATTRRSSSEDAQLMRDRLLRRWPARCAGARWPRSRPSPSPRRRWASCCWTRSSRPCGATNAPAPGCSALNPADTPVPRRYPRARLECRRQADGDRARRGSRTAGARPRALRPRRLGDRRGGAPRR